MMSKRECEFCRDWTPGYLQEYYQVSEMECGCCNDTKELDIRECFCHAYEASECCCNALWDDDYYDDYPEPTQELMDILYIDHYNWEEQDFEEGKLMYENGLERLEELPKMEKK